MEKTVEKTPLNNRIPKVPFNILLDNKLIQSTLFLLELIEFVDFFLELNENFFELLFSSSDSLFREIFLSSIIKFSFLFSFSELNKLLKDFSYYYLIY